jgi:beta-glucosidase-like glycosyl hydrolase/CubicO group peptidase (beta-lactamase class C family)
MLRPSSFILLAFWLCSSFSWGQSHVINWKKTNPWVDSVFNSLNQNEKIAQLITVAVWSTRDSNYLRDIETIVRDYKVGGLMFMKGTPHKQASLTNRYQRFANLPLLISIDAEWGLNMRIDSTPVFPRQMVLGAADDPELTRKMGAEIAKHCHRMGIQLNFAPDVDINNNPANPVINDRSFGENKEIVAKHGVAYAKGLQENRILACAKHFPGHGDTESDSHHDLPIINASRERLDSLELYPFRMLIQNKVGAVMVGHLFVPAIDSIANTATSISPKAIKSLLQNELGFDGLVISDGLNMKGVANYASSGEVSAKAFAAGNELLLFVEDVPNSIFWIKEYLKTGLIKQEDIDRACRKILTVKYWAGLNKYKPVALENLYEDLNCCETELLIKKIVQKGIVVAKNLDHIIPLEKPQDFKIASVAVGNSKFTDFQQMLENYIRADYYSIDKNESKTNFDSLFSTLQRYNLVIISLHNTSRFVSKKLGLTQQQINFINRLLVDRKCILVNHGNPYILQHFQNARNVVLAYEDLPVYNTLSAQVLCGAFGSTGKMPVSVNPAFPLASGEFTEALNRFEYIMPEEAGYDHTPLSYIDSIVSEGIKAKAFPGCQVLVASEGKVIYNKSFGTHTYDSPAVKVENYHLYDVASLTKILATTLAIMKLYDEKAIGLNDRLGLYIPALKGTSKEKITIREVLTHQAGFTPFIPFYKKAMGTTFKDSAIFSKIKTKHYNTQVADSLYINKGYEQELFAIIAQSDLKKQGEYLYSDLGFILLRKLVENVSNQSFESYLQENIYNPLNLGNIRFNPMASGVPKNRIPPTELDSEFRKQLIHGYVHDPAAAMLGGVSGHAGLFSNANDVAVIMQMLLNEGTYGGVRIFKETTVALFTKRQSKEYRRGLGFDKPETIANKPTPTGKNCSPLTFGHTGFTGTCAWADPKNNLVYVFLSNRVNPSAENNKLANLNIRTRIHDLIYEVTRRKMSYGDFK